MRAAAIEFEYKRRYNKPTLSSRIKALIHSCKARFFKTLLKYKWVKLDPFDMISYKQEAHDKYALSHAFSNTPDIIPFLYQSVELHEVHYIEGLEIDNFDTYKKKIIGQFSKDKSRISFEGINELRKNLSNVKEDLGTISWGSLFSLTYITNRKEANDLIDYINVGYIKTGESYFVLDISVKPSAKFKNVFKECLKYKDVALTEVHYKSFKEILRTGRFVDHGTVVSSLKCRNIKNLISDLTAQVRNNVTKKLDGMFQDSKVFKEIPRIECYEVENIGEFHKDRDLSGVLQGGFKNPYKSEGGEVEIYLSELDRDSVIFQVLKQKDCVLFAKEGSTLDRSRLENYYLLKSLVFPCFFTATLSMEDLGLKKIKRNIYDFIKSSSKSGINGGVSAMFSHRNYLKLKLGLVQILLTLKRFENEFSQQNLLLYTRSFDLTVFQTNNNNIKEKSLSHRFVQNFLLEIKSLDKKAKSINEIFKSIEEVNSYRTNLVLQVISVFIGLLAFIFTFEKAKKLIIGLVNYFFN